MNNATKHFSQMLEKCSKNKRNNTLFIVRKTFSHKHAKTHINEYKWTMYTLTWKNFAGKTKRSTIKNW